MLLVFGLSQPSIRLVRSYAFDNQHSTAQHGFNSVFFLFLSLLFSIVHTALVQLYWCIKFMSMYFSLVFILNVLYIEPMHLETLVSLVLKITQKIVTFQSSHYIAFSILRIVFFFRCFGNIIQIETNFWQTTSDCAHKTDFNFYLICCFFFSHIFWC